MFFPGREVSQCAQPVVADDLVVGRIYFMVNYDDDDLLIPTLEPVVFLGKNIVDYRNDQESDDIFYFQDYSSHRNGVPHRAYEEPVSEGGSEEHLIRAVFHDGTERMLSMVFDFNHALDSLLGCSLRRAEGSGMAAGAQ